MNKSKHKKKFHFFIFFLIVLILISSRYFYLKKADKVFWGAVCSNEIVVYPLKTAKIQKIYVNVNDEVKENELLIEFDTNLISNKIKQIQASIDFEKTQENILKTNENTALDEYLNYKKEKNTDISELNNKLKQLEAIQSDYNLQQKKVFKLEAELAYCKEKKKNLFIYSPCSGLIQNVFVNKNQNVISNEKLLTIFQSDHIWLEAKIPMSKYKIGDDFNICFEDFPDTKFQGKIYSIINDENSSKYKKVKLSINQLKIKPNEVTLLLKNGMKAQFKYE